MLKREQGTQVGGIDCEQLRAVLCCFPTSWHTEAWNRFHSPPYLPKITKKNRWVGSRNFLFSITQLRMRSCRFSPFAFQDDKSSSVSIRGRSYASGKFCSICAIILSSDNPAVKKTEAGIPGGKFIVNVLCYHRWAKPLVKLTSSLAKFTRFVQTAMYHEVTGRHLLLHVNEQNVFCVPATSHWW